MHMHMHRRCAPYSDRRSESADRLGAGTAAREVRWAHGKSSRKVVHRFSLSCDSMLYECARTWPVHLLWGEAGAIRDNADAVPFHQIAFVWRL